MQLPLKHYPEDEVEKTAVQDQAAPELAEPVRPQDHPATVLERGRCQTGDAIAASYIQALELAHPNKPIEEEELYTYCQTMYGAESVPVYNEYHDRWDMGTTHPCCITLTRSEGKKWMQTQKERDTKAQEMLAEHMAVLEEHFGKVSDLLDKLCPKGVESSSSNNSRFCKLPESDVESIVKGMEHLKRVVENHLGHIGFCFRNPGDIKFGCFSLQHLAKTLHKNEELLLHTMDKMEFLLTFYESGKRIVMRHKKASQKWWQRMARKARDAATAITSTLWRNKLSLFLFAAVGSGALMFGGAILTGILASITSAGSAALGVSGALLTGSGGALAILSAFSMFLTSICGLMTTGDMLLFWMPKIVSLLMNSINWNTSAMKEEGERQLKEEPKESPASEEGTMWSILSEEQRESLLSRITSPVVGGFVEKILWGFSQFLYYVLFMLREVGCVNWSLLAISSRVLMKGVGRGLSSPRPSAAPAPAAPPSPAGLGATPPPHMVSTAPPISAMQSQLLSQNLEEARVKADALARATGSASEAVNALEGKMETWKKQVEYYEKWGLTTRLGSEKHYRDAKRQLQEAQTAFGTAQERLSGLDRERQQAKEVMGSLRAKLAFSGEATPTMSSATTSPLTAALQDTSRLQEEVVKTTKLEKMALDLTDDAGILAKAKKEAEDAQAALAASQSKVRVLSEPFQIQPSTTEAKAALGSIQIDRSNMSAMEKELGGIGAQPSSDPTASERLYAQISNPYFLAGMTLVASSLLGFYLYFLYRRRSKSEMSAIVRKNVALQRAFENKLEIPQILTDAYQEDLAQSKILHQDQDIMSLRRFLDERIKEIGEPYF